MKKVRNITSIKWVVLATVFVVILTFQLLLFFRYQINAWELLLETVVIMIMAYLIVYFSFREMLKREKKLKDTMKELFSSYQYIGNANRQIDMLTNFSKYVTKGDFTDEEIISFVVNTAGRLANADFTTVFLWDENKSRFKKSKIYYHTDKALFDSILSHLRCETCEAPLTDNEFILEVNKNSEKKCKFFPESFWDTYTMICFPIVFKGKKKGNLMLVHNNKVEISHLNFKLISSLASQLGSAIK